MMSNAIVGDRLLTAEASNKLRLLLAGLALGLIINLM